MIVSDDKLPTHQLFIDGRGDVPLMIMKGKVISLRALEQLTPQTVALLEILATPEMDGQVVRIENRDGQVRLVKTGLVGHVLHKAKGASR